MRIDHSQAKQGRYLIPEGEYETIVQSAEFSETKSGKEFINIQLLIRSDVEQEEQDETIEYPLYKRKNPSRSDQACDGYSANQIQIISKCANIENGKEFPTLNEWFSEIVGKLLRVTVKHEEYNGYTNARVGYMYETNYPECNIELFAAEGMLIVDDENLPF